MTTKEEVDLIRHYYDTGYYGLPEVDCETIDAVGTLLSAYDDANKRIAELAAKTPKSELVGYGAWMTHAKVAEAKLAKVREWAERASRHNAGSDYERDDRDMEREQCGDEVLAILDDKDTP